MNMPERDSKNLLPSASVREEAEHRMPLNPYIAGNPIGGAAGFFGRDDIFREVMQVLRHPQSNAIVLYGQRRIGKTSVLLQLERRLDSDGEFTSVYFDLQDKATKPLDEVLYELAQHIAVKTHQAAPDRANFDSDGDYFRQTFLPTAAGAAARGGLVLLFDEFDVLDSPDQNRAGQAFFPYLRAWMAGIEGVQFVFVIGRRPEDLSIETMSTFKGVRAARVSLFERSIAEVVMRQSERDGSLFWTDAAVERIWDWTQGHPYLTQLLCSVVWEDAYAADHSATPRVEAAGVDAAIDQALQQGANAFHWIWGGLPPAERVVMAAMAEADDEVITQEKLVEILNRSGVRLIVRALELAPDTLVGWELLRPVGQGYCFVVPLLRRWTATNRPLRRVKDELDRLDPLAEMLFQAGQRFYSLGQPAEAETQLRQALRINPNHLKSRLLLGRILLEGGQVAESVAILEEAYQYDEGAARADLIKALLALADGQAEAEQLATFNRVLSIAPNQPVARERRQAIWVERGEAALKQDDLEAALSAFQEAGDLSQVEQVQQLKRKRELTAQIETAETHGAQENWEAAVAIYEALLQQFPDDEEWKARLENAQTQSMLAQRYNEALGALETSDMDTAKRLLAEVIAQQPDYKDAALYLLYATKNMDDTELKQQLTALQQRRKAREPKAKPKQRDEWTNPNDGAVMVYIPEGEFLMGDDDPHDAKPKRKVTLDGYWIYKYPVTVAQYRKFCDATKQKMPDAPGWGWSDDHPIIIVSWDDAVAYCEWASETSFRLRLPTEAEWEKAARGTDGRKYPWGDEWDASKCNNYETGPKQTTAVGSYPQGASPFGVMDMAGNVWEWCADWYDENYYKDAPNQNPMGPTKDTGRRVLRGGSWNSDLEVSFRCASRYWHHPDLRWLPLGFRCAAGADFR